MNIEPPSGRQTFAHQRSMADRLKFHCVLVLCIACFVVIKWPFVSINTNTMYRKRTAIRYLCSLFAHSFNRYLNYVLITRRSKLNTQFTNIYIHICSVRLRIRWYNRNENSENGRTNAKSRQRHLHRIPDSLFIGFYCHASELQICANFRSLIASNHIRILFILHRHMETSTSFGALRWLTNEHLNRWVLADRHITTFLIFTIDCM